ncbi:sulfatase-like hydrolase/transferase [Photobacterium lutimaris]|uniref:Arylsulfatase n=1 Tax=Photobacterium lutimaris TaxID=388278 RepID=A0A2T3IY65_9GAMM|nr:sulfatase-like hydrolase/transferase [Photobacterium lutimaris]PSU33531.1 arylsulfatase [Photobacterium lutimaris]TDR74633.1 arylsulfatase [Photobacterium lutimaris]
MSKKKVVASSIAGLLLPSLSYAADVQPNVVIMMVDNLGFGELQSYGSVRGVPTPNLDQLAKEGIRLTNFNVEPQCTPTRSAFMTGRRPLRTATTEVVWGMDYGMVNWEVTMANKFKELGYNTAIYGKWHLGDTEGRTPLDQGFDDFFGVLNTSDESIYSSQLHFDKEDGEIPQIQDTKDGKIQNVMDFNLETRRTIDGEITDRAVTYISEQLEAGSPFFTFVSFTQPHLPTIPHPDFAGVTGKGDYADVLHELDHRAGQIIDTIEDAGARDNTLIIWLSDNGPEWHYPHHGISAPWRGGYFTALEGAIRVPFIASMPGTIKEGNVSNEIVHVVDVMPTVGELVGYDMPTDRHIDGINQWAFLKGDMKQSNRDGFYISNGQIFQAYKWNDWKLHFYEQDIMPEAPVKRQIPAIYDLSSDPQEMYDLRDDAVRILPTVIKRSVAAQQNLATGCDTIPFPAPNGYEPDCKGADFSKFVPDGYRKAEK